MTGGKHIKKAVAMEDVEIEFVSLVDRPANKRKLQALMNGKRQASRAARRNRR
jgi:hypothetical protein